ncbi:hypothetical protein [Qipengyuania sp. 902]|uniref:hypothetical protein n=1 Tax=Qipengyuania sp. 902 TaxID=3417565 RepID=UPI003EBD9D4A
MAIAKFRRFQVYGQRCSGTNALIKLLERNLDELQFTEDFGFKHWLVPEEVEIPGDVFVVVIARQVDQWLRSLHAKPWHAHPELKQMDFGEFIRAKWRSVWDEDFWGIDKQHPKFGQPIEEELCPQTGSPFPNAIAMRTAKLRHWSDVASRATGHALVSHSELVIRPERLIERLAAAARLEKRREFVPVTTYKGQNSSSFVPTEYPPVHAADAAFIARYLDQSVESQFALGPLPHGTGNTRTARLASS